QHRAAVAVHPGQVFDGEGAAVGDHQGAAWHQPGLEQPVARLLYGGVVVAVAVEAVPQDGQGPQLIDDRGDADMDDLVLAGVAAGDVGGWDVGGGVVLVEGPGDVVGARLGAVVGAGEGQGRGVEVQAGGGQFGQAQGLGGDAGEDGVALAEEGVEGPAEAVVVEAGRRDAPKEIGAGLLCPGGEVAQGGGLAEACGQQQAEDT